MHRQTGEEREPGTRQPEYEAPAVERVMGAEELAREALYAGVPVGSDFPT